MSPTKRIPSGFNSSAIKGSIRNVKVASPSKRKSKNRKKTRNDKSRSVSKSVSKSMSKSATKSRSRSKSRSRNLKATRKKKGTKMEKAHSNKSVADEVAKQDSSVMPTALIGPADYEHIYNAPKGAKGKMVNPSSTTEEDQPTALIAPNDYEHIYMAKGKETDPRKPAPKNKDIPDDAPTILKEIVHKKKMAKSGDEDLDSKDGEGECCCRVM